MEGKWSMSYPVTLYLSYAISLQSPPGYPTPPHSHSIVPGGLLVMS
jgi:hypothetical protein